MNEEVKRSGLTERMRAARQKGVVALQGYNTLRSKHPRDVIIALEGDDDPIFYKTCIRNIDSSFKWVPLVCRGKDNVLALRVLLERNTDEDASKTYYMIDRDYDHLKGHVPGPNLYCTPGYSIENLLVTSSVFEELLVGEYKCAAGEDEIAELKALFGERLDEFFDAIGLANRALHYCRVKGIRCGSVDNRIKQYVSVTLDAVTSRYGIDDLERLIGIPEGFDIFDCDDTTAKFTEFDPADDWRGKFTLFFFVEFLTQLREDRCSFEPKRFKERRKVTFNPNSSILRVLSSMIDPPSCLNAFITRIAA
ncbi:DUF4435 domain-containing protein [Cognatiyoonia sp. IB215182]|uniref:DUF4435 domain-containing protein n=1 Tax=Cognatiyoonia sp. IB215182 TaxID=3097353 RepID=UPI002A0CB3DD|nr:DUF4435 domain-containing protein [Cognatiyoonia sp. IB215182]MDX8354348.1 DUF4435 domain-containing protein [Cognatiyoonia sp. IB215182]